MATMLVASNRGPISFGFDGEGRLQKVPSGGGLAGTLRPLVTGIEATWIASSMHEADRVAAEKGLMVDGELSVALVTPDHETYRQAYDVISNSTLWYCHHHLFDTTTRPRFDRRWHEAWDAYRRVNRLFADAIADHAEDGATVLVQDYHLALLGKMLTDTRPDLVAIHFTHTPFAAPEILGMLPDSVSSELLTGMAGFSACGFHTVPWQHSFIRCLEVAGRESDLETFAAPLGIDAATLEAECRSEDVAKAIDLIDAAVGDRRLIVRVDRVEPSKNVLRGFAAFDELLETNASLRGAVTFLALVYPSRESLADYLSYRSEVEHAAARINEKWAEDDWVPIILDVADNRARSLAALCRYDVLLVNPIRDGLNLVAKEGPAVNRREGLVVLSRQAGAWEEMHEVALGLNPFDISETAAQMSHALTMDPDGRRRRSAATREVAIARTARNWMRDLLEVAARRPAGSTAS